MKRLIIVFTTILLLLLLAKPIWAVNEYRLFLPLVSVPRVSVIDCMTADGRLTECP